MSEYYWCETCQKQVSATTCPDCGQPTARTITDEQQWKMSTSSLSRLKLVAVLRDAAMFTAPPPLPLTGEYCDQ